MGLARIYAALLIASGLSIIAPVGGAEVRGEAYDESYLTGFLTWNDGRGRITWEGAPPSEDDVDPGNHEAGLYEEFVSDPVPRTLFLNVSRLIQLDLFVKDIQPSNYRYLVHVEIRAGTKLLTLGHASANANVNPAKAAYFPSAPGCSPTAYRTQAELDVVERGAILTLRLIHISTVSGAYGFAGDHHSVLRLPLFSPDEVLFRVPRYEAPAPPAPAPPLPGLDELARLLERLLGAGAAIAVAVLGARSSGRHGGSRALLLFAVLAAGSLAGCVGGRGENGKGNDPSSNLGGSAESFIVPDPTNETGLANSSRGSIYGTISDTERLPVNGAYIALLGTPASTRSDPDGRFKFLDLRPGDFRIRVDRDGFLPLETVVDVEAGGITKVQVVLEYVNAKDITLRPHRHDSWVDAAGKPTTSIVLLDQPVDLSTGQGQFVLPAPLAILPGTVDVELNLTWQGAGKAYLVARPPHDPDLFNSTALGSRPSGVPYHLRTTWEMTDPGHTHYTYWRWFSLFPEGARCPPSGPVPFVDTSSCPEPDYRLRLTIHKGVVPLEPAHPNHWRGGTEVNVVFDETKQLRRICSPACPFVREQAPTGNILIVGLASKPYNVSWQPGTFVPFETERIELRLQADRDSATKDIAWKLMYRSAETSNYGLCDPGNVYNLDAARPASLLASDPATRTSTWRIDPKPGEADAPYAKRTNWCFFVAPDDPNRQMLDDHANSGNLPSFTLRVTAHRQAP